MDVPAVPPALGDACVLGLCAIVKPAKVKDAIVVMRMLKREIIVSLLFIR